MAKADDKMIDALLRQIKVVKKAISEAEKRGQLILNKPPIGPWPKKILKTLIRMEKQLLKLIGKLEKRLQALKKPSPRKRARKSAA